MSENKHLETLSEIRDIMDRSTRFLSLSGLSGISAGIVALIGAFVGYQTVLSENSGILGSSEVEYDTLLVKKLFYVAMATLAGALISGFIFTFRKAQKNDQAMWGKSSKRLIINLAIPLAVGGVYCISLIWSYNFYLVPPTTLIFYGLALINASKYTLPEIRTLGIFECILGLTGCFLPVYGIILWGAGFGLLHIIYGSMMYFKYDRQSI